MINSKKYPIRVCAAYIGQQVMQICGLDQSAPLVMSMQQQSGTV